MAKYIDVDYKYIAFYVDDEGNNRVNWRVDQDDANYVVLAKQEYFDLKNRNSELLQERRAAASASRIPEGKVLIDKDELIDLKQHYLTDEELNGYFKALEIIRDKSKLQIDKSIKDKHGYTTKNAKKIKGKHLASDYWVITKSTPYSLKLPVDVVYDLVLEDLHAHYRYLNNFKMNTIEVNGERIDYFFSDVLEYLTKGTVRNGQKGPSGLDKYFSEELGLEAFEGYSYDFEGLDGSNIGAGVYTIKYKATKPI